MDDDDEEDGVGDGGVGSELSHRSESDIEVDSDSRGFSRSVCLC